MIHNILEKLNRPDPSDTNINIGRRDIEISKGNFYFPLQNNFRVNFFQVLIFRKLIIIYDTVNDFN